MHLLSGRFGMVSASIILLATLHAAAQDADKPPPPKAVAGSSYMWPTFSQSTYSFRCPDRSVSMSWTQTRIYPTQGRPEEVVSGWSIVLEKNGKRLDIEPHVRESLAWLASVEKVEGLCGVTFRARDDTGVSAIRLEGHGQGYPDNADRQACKARSGTWRELSSVNIDFDADGKIATQSVFGPQCDTPSRPSPSAG